MKKRLKFFEKWILLALILLLPTQLAYHFWPPWAFVFGIRIDYLAPAVYLTDVFVFALVLSNIAIYKKYLGIIFGVLACGVINSVFSTVPAVSVMRWGKIVELVLFAIFIAKQNLLKRSTILITLFCTTLFFSLIGIAQFVFGKTLGGPLYLLGERSFNIGTPGIALVSLWGREFMRAYSTFSHPNSLGGFVGVVIIITFSALRKHRYFFLGLLGLIICFILSFSVTAFLAIGSVTFFALLLKRKAFRKITFFVLGLAILVSLVLPIVSQKLISAKTPFRQNLSQRLELAYFSGRMVSERFLVGEGLGTFTVNLSKFRGALSYSWLLQPVHNMFLLTFSESGILGLLLFSFLLFKLIRKNVSQNSTTILLALIFVLITGLVDHYWLTLQQNALLLSLLAGMSFHQKQKVA